MSGSGNHITSLEGKEEISNGVSVDENDGESVKRRRNESDNDSKDNEELGDLKKSRLEELDATSTAKSVSVFSFGTEQSEIVEKMEISPDKVGQIIGSRGAVIQEMQARSGCKINVNQDFPPGVNREVTFTGTRDQITAARNLIAMVLEQGPTAIHMLNGPVVTEILECAQALVGRIIGAGGATIRDIQARCGARVQIDQNFPEGVPRKITVTGNAESVQGAVTMIKFVMENGPPGMHWYNMQIYHCISNYVTGSMGLSTNIIMGGGLGMGGMAPSMMPGSVGVGGFVTSTGPLNVAAGSTPTATTLESAKAYVGRLIGRGGETINLIQSRSGARVQIEQNVPEGAPCRVNITGNPQNVAIAAQIIQDIIVNGPNSASAVLSSVPNIGGMMQSGTAGYYGAPAGVAGYAIPQQVFNGYGQSQQGMGMYQQQGGYNPALQQGPNGYGHHQQQPVYSGGVQYGGTGAGNSWSNTTITTGRMPAAAPTKLPAGWTEHKTEDGNSYWHNASIGVSQVLLYFQILCPYNTTHSL